MRAILQRRNIAGGYTLLEVLAMSVLLVMFLVGFYLGSMRMSASMLVQQDRNEALLQSRRLGEGWRAGVTISGITKGYYLNAVPYTVSTATTQTSETNSTLKKLSVTLSWKEPDPNSTGASPTPRNMHIKDVYLNY
jgi:Tfp pilus assembly protein PilV